jgi:hypothetical protein
MQFNNISEESKKLRKKTKMRSLDLETMGIAAEFEQQSKYEF